MERGPITPDCSPDTSDNLTSSYDRNHTGTHSSDTESPGNAKKRKRVHFSDASSETETIECGSSSVTIPTNISEWTEEVLSCLGIKVDENRFGMYDVFMRGCLHVISEEKTGRIMSSFANRDRVNKITIDSLQYVFQEVFTLDYHSISSIKMTDLIVMEAVLKNPLWMKSFAEHYSEKKVCIRILKDISRKLQKFVWQLMHMVRTCHNQEKEVSEGMFHKLFVLFAEVFNLNIVAGSNVEKYKLNIEGNNTYVAVPDGVVCHPLTTEEKVCAVIQVEKISPDGNETAKAKRVSRKGGRTCRPHQIGSETQGQHVGQCLCVLPRSLFGNRGIFGILVQETNVSISSFKAEEWYYQSLSSGHSIKTGAIVTFSDQYNILQKEGRMECIQALLDLKKLLELLCEKDFP